MDTDTLMKPGKEFAQWLGVEFMTLLGMSTDNLTEESAIFLGIYMMVMTTLMVGITTYMFSGMIDADDLKDIEFMAYRDLKELIENGGLFVRESWIAVDCKVPLVDCITHHKESTTPRELKGDTSTALVISALEMNHPVIQNRRNVTCNHFDIDGYLSVICTINPDLALEFKNQFEMAARVGDFRLLDMELPHADLALKVCCVVNALEREKFTLPFEADDSPKWPFFLEEVDAETLISNPTEVAREHGCDWETEYRRVLDDYEQVRDEKISKVERDPETTLCFITTPEPRHYYSTFGAAGDCDTVVAIYSENRFEVEQRYTGFVNLTSRDTLPRVDMVGLANQLNELEKNEDCHWVANRFVDTGPLLRLEPKELSNLDRVQRYMNPYQRRILSSSIDATEFTAVVTRYFEEAYHIIEHKKQSVWNWEELHAINKEIKAARST